MVLLVKRAVSLLMVLCLTVGCFAPTASAAVAPVAPPVSSGKGGQETESVGLIIRAILMGASRLWSYSWFRGVVIGGVRIFSNSRAANAVQRLWDSLGRTVDNLIGTESLTWTAVRDRVLPDTG